MKEVPNLTFSKTNFTGYNIEIRGIGTQAISVATDPAVAVALNDIPFIRNHFFEQEFYDVGQVEVLRGPQGTLYGRNATAGVVNVISAKPTDQFEAMLSADLGNYTNRRYEGMINIPIVDDRLDMRLAGEWTKRDGYTFNTITNSPIDGRDLWSGRAHRRLQAEADVQVYFVWEHFQENDDRLRSRKQLCETDNPPASVDGVPVPPGGTVNSMALSTPSRYLSQGCKTGLALRQGRLRANADYGAFGVPDGYTLPYVKAAALIGAINPTLDPYAGTSQSTNLRDIESTVNPHYTREERHAGVECGLQRHACANFLFANRLQPRFPLVHGGLQPLQYVARAIPQSYRFYARASPASPVRYTDCGMAYRPACVGRILIISAIRRSDAPTGWWPSIFGRTCLAIQPGIPAGIEFQRPVQFQHRR